MGQIEELDEDQDICSQCQKTAKTKACTACRAVYYCCKECQKKHWKEHKFQCKALPYKFGKSPELGRFLEASRDIKKGEILWTEPALVVGPVAVTPPVCICCYSLVDGSFK